MKAIHLKLLLGGVVLYFLFLLIQMPAAWLLARLPADAPIQVSRVEGNLWQGSAARVTWRAAAQSLDLGKLTWQWIPAELLQGRLGYQFSLGQGADALKGIFQKSRNGNALKGVQGRVNATALGLFTPPLTLIQPQGDLLLDIPDLYWNSSRIHGEARLDWRNARSSLVATPLGDYRGELHADPDGRRARVNVRTSQGALGINGEGYHSPGKGIEGRLLLTPPQDEARRALFTPLLNLLGRPDASGTVALNLTPSSQSR